jgi:hypothetical protein
MGDSRSCLTLGEMFVAGCGVASDDERAAELFERACDLGDDLACGEYGIVVSRYGLSHKSSAKISKQLMKGCDGGHAKACRHLGDLIDRGAGLAPDVKIATGLWERACTLGDPDGCLRAGRVYAIGIVPVAPNRMKAQRLLNRACMAQRREACRMLGEGVVAREGAQ